MSPQARDATIKHFSTFQKALGKSCIDGSLVNNVSVTVFLVSLKAGGVALNLTEASRVYLMDSWWNPAVEFRTSLIVTCRMIHYLYFNRGNGSYPSSRPA